MIEALLVAIHNIVSLDHMIYLLFGVVIGLVVGILPGLGGIAGLSIVMPFLYGINETSALMMLIGLVVVIPTSDTFASILLGIPGSSASQATVLDGFPLSQQGQAARALSAAFFASLLGGLVGALVLTFFVQIARPLILHLGSAELFMLALFGLSMVGSLSGKNVIQGLAACCFGLIVGAIGSAPTTGEFRVTFGIEYLYDGLPLVVIGLGIFAIPEIIHHLSSNRSISKVTIKQGQWIEGINDVLNNKLLVLRCSGIGTLIGAIPGLGGTVVDWIAYGHVKQIAKDKSNFGKGDIRGVLAPESANNAKEGGGLVPTLLFGVPGSGAMAVFLGGMILLGIEAGPSMISSNLDLTYTIVWSLALANVFAASACIFIAKPISRLTTIPFNFLAPFMIVLIFFAAFQATKSYMDLVALLIIGIIGVLLKQYRWSRPAFLIGFVLSSQIESYLNLAIQFYGWGMFLRPGVLIILGLTFFSVFYSNIKKHNRNNIKNNYSQIAHTDKSESIRSQILFISFLIFILIYSIWSTLKLSSLGSIFVQGVGLVSIGLCLYLIGALVFFDSENSIDLGIKANGNKENIKRKEGFLTNILWLLFFLILIGLIGFILGAALFFVLFLRCKAKIRWSAVILFVSSIIFFLYLLLNIFIVQLPTGILLEQFG